MRGEGRKKPFAERSLIPSRLRTGKKGRNKPRKRAQNSSQHQLMTVHRGPIVGDINCSEADYHTVKDSGFYDPNGHSITKERFESVWNPEVVKA